MAGLGVPIGTGASPPRMKLQLLSRIFSHAVVTLNVLSCVSVCLCVVSALWAAEYLCVQITKMVTSLKRNMHRQMPAQLQVARLHNRF